MSHLPVSKGHVGVFMEEGPILGVVTGRDGNKALQYFGQTRTST